RSKTQSETDQAGTSARRKIWANSSILPSGLSSTAKNSLPTFACSVITSSSLPDFGQPSSMRHGTDKLHPDFPHGRRTGRRRGKLSVASVSLFGSSLEHPLTGEKQ
ncbi:hypothetical protein, partial [Antrihabitans spumae]